jgi:hypothetical protein
MDPQDIRAKWQQKDTGKVGEKKLSKKKFFDATVNRTRADRLQPL